MLTEVRAGGEAWERELKWVRLESGKSLELLSFRLNNGFVRNFRLRRLPTGAKGSGAAVAAGLIIHFYTVAVRIGKPEVRSTGGEVK